MQKKIIRRDYPKDIAATLEGIHPLLQRIYAARHVNSIQELELSLAHLLPYQSLLGIEPAAHLLGEAITQNQRILIVGDFDADGATSTALAMRALRSLGAKQVQYLVPNRFAFGYGLTPELVAVTKDFMPQLIITVDNGIANHAGVEAAKAQGMRVLITDHHLPATTLPPADVIVNPNQPGDLFPSKQLAGVGVIFYVMLATRRYLINLGWFEKQQLPEANLSKLLDLVALGTVADLVALDRNNRILVDQGMRRIRAGQCVPAIVALLELSNRDFRRAFTADLGFSVASRLNAAGRLDDMSLGIECLLSDDAIQVREMARTLDTLNVERKSIEQDMHTQALHILRELDTRLNGELPYGLCLFDESWHQGVIGILASRIKDRFHRPVVVFAPGQQDELKGSARSIAGLHIRDVFALIEARHPGLILKFGGHAMAAGLSIKNTSLQDFITIFDKTVAEQITETSLQHVLLSDGELALEDFNLEVASLIQHAGPWGQSFSEPLFDDTFQIIEQRLVGDKHLKLKLAKQNKMFDAIAFFIDTKIWPNNRCQSIHAAYRLNVNEYKNQKNIQLVIEYLEQR
ncbi:MAG: single-stranded-DNA-specific exonuclease RecJ [Gammaproteobacteria bacterium RIFCSPHIGHO2_12_FULL_37_14]|nr:MAG: single-stranded-DNA-specific exonuclease RecJ [Gammaproteobacteria bacterium RIFCSPHIGHO2_12_FULL_37_14]